MHITLKNLASVQSKVNKIVEEKQLKTKPNIIVVTKKFSLEKITPIIESGHIHFGENKIQEAESKWSDIKVKYSNLKLHLVGKLQTNKSKKAIKIFDYIHSLDNAKLASKICQYEKELNKKVKLFIQVNIANEDQKSGIQLNDLNNFYQYCSKDLSLDVIGLMCLPPAEIDPEEYFKILQNVSKKFNLKDLSMGMSSDFDKAIVNGSTYLRLGTIIMGPRD